MDDGYREPSMGLVFDQLTASAVGLLGRGGTRVCVSEDVSPQSAISYACEEAPVVKYVPEF